VICVGLPDFFISSLSAFLTGKKKPTYKAGFFKTKNQLLDFRFFMHNVLTAKELERIPSFPRLSAFLTGKKKPT